MIKQKVPFGLLETAYRTLLTFSPASRNFLMIKQKVPLGLLGDPQQSNSGGFLPRIKELSDGKGTNNIPNIAEDISENIC
jgi:hypothetical protein